jgi:hypothetical protein
MSQYGEKEFSHFSLLPSSKTHSPLEGSFYREIKRVFPFFKKKVSLFSSEGLNCSKM